MAPAELTGLRVLLVEDQMIVAMEIESLLHGFGCAVVGPVATLEPALQLAREAALDAAVLDVNLDGETVGPVAEALQARGIPVVLSTGYGAATLPEDLRGLPLLEKPFTRTELETLMRSVCIRA
jgi:CheY-like chemotaxis protein